MKNKDGFKVGDVLEFNPTSGGNWAAKKGSMAKVYNLSPDYVHINWIESPLIYNDSKVRQNDGGYYYQDFKLVKTKIEIKVMEPKDEVAKLEAQLKATQDAIKKLKEAKPAFKFEVGKFYQHKRSKTTLVFCKTLRGTSNYGFWYGEFSNQLSLTGLLDDFRPATPAEVKAIFEKEAKKRFKMGDMFNCAVDGSKYEVEELFVDISNVGEYGELLITNDEYDSGFLFNDTKGTWAEKAVIMKLGSYKVSRDGNYINIGCKELTINQVKTISDVMYQNDFDSITFEVEGSKVKVTLDQIDAILALKK